MPKPDEELNRVSSAIGRAILEFARVNRTFHAEDLRRAVSTVSVTAPASADRVLRDLRQRGLISYRVVSRTESLYEVESVTP
jgi:hypothetical protein